MNWINRILTFFSEITTRPVSESYAIGLLKYRYARRQEFYSPTETEMRLDLRQIERVKLLFKNTESREKIIFHGGCLYCKSPELHTVNRCRKCQYMLPDWSRPNLNISERNKTI